MSAVTMPDAKLAQKRANLRTGLILGSIAVAFFIGFMVKMILLGR